MSSIDEFQKEKTMPPAVMSSSRVYICVCVCIVRGKNSPNSGLNRTDTLRRRKILLSSIDGVPRNKIARHTVNYILYYFPFYRVPFSMLHNVTIHVHTNSDTNKLCTIKKYFI